MPLRDERAAKVPETDGRWWSRGGGVLGSWYLPKRVLGPRMFLKRSAPAWTGGDLPEIISGMQSRAPHADNAAGVARCNCHRTATPALFSSTLRRFTSVRELQQHQQMKEPQGTPRRCARHYPHSQLEYTHTVGRRTPANRLPHLAVPAGTAL